MATKTALVIAATAVLSAACVSPASQREAGYRITAADYAAAERLSSRHLRGKVLNLQPEVRWLESRDAFWYRHETTAGADYVLVDAATGDRFPGYEPPLQGEPAPPPGRLVSSDGVWSAFARDHNLWIVNHDTGDERRLTRDGSPYFSYGGWPDQYRLAALRTGSDRPLRPAATHWSPDGRYLIVGRLDERDVLAYPFLESVPAGGGVRPRAYSLRIPLLGDAGRRRTESFVFDIETGDRFAIELPAGFSLEFFTTGNAPIAWAADSGSAYLIAATEGDRIVRLLEIDMATGTARTILEERAATSVTLGPNLLVGPNVRILEDTREVVWFSERDGWGHLYLYDLDSGQRKSRVTEGHWSVWEILHVDANDRVIYFTAGGREPGSDPYHQKLYRASLDGNSIRLLTPEDAHHEILGGLSPSGRFFVEVYSTVDTAPRLLLRSSRDGNIVADLVTADATALYATGWRAPERFAVKAADGTADIWVTVYLPPNFDPARSYPVIDAIYGGPASIVAARTFGQAHTSSYQPSSLARLGFIVVSVDGRGTPYRSRAFRESGYGNFADPQLEDHIAAIRQVAKRYPSADLDRVGIYGHSNGGYMAARAMFRHPEFFKVGVASAGPHNFHGLPGTGMPWMGIPRYEGGASTKPTEAAVPQNYQILDNRNFASGLQGALLLIAGDMDNTAFPALTMQLVQALNEANKTYDLLLLPNRTHGYFAGEPYVMRRIWDYFVEHLHGTAPPADYEIRQYDKLVYQQAF